MASKVEQNTQIFTGILTFAYLIVIIKDIVKWSGFESITVVEVINFSFFLLFLFGAICCMDYPMITAITFFSWIFLRLILSGQLFTEEHPSYDGITIFIGFINVILGIIFLWIWWDKREKFET